MRFELIKTRAVRQKSLAALVFFVFSGATLCSQEQKEGRLDFTAELTPLLLAGGRGAGVSPGRQLEPRRSTSLSDLHLAMLRKAGVRAAEFGGSERALGALDG